MAGEKKDDKKNKKNPGKQALKYVLVAGLSITGCWTLSKIEEHSKPKETNSAIFSSEIYTSEGKPIVGRKIRIKTDSSVYGTVSDAINGVNGKTPYYNIDEERYVMSAFYQYNNDIIRVDMNNCAINENRILTENGKLVAVLTTVNPETKEQEAYYSAEDIKVSTKIINLVKN